MASAAEWSRRVASWRRSGLSAEEFASGKDYRAKTLAWWSSELKRRERSRPARDGENDHATSAANRFSLIASCQLHGLDPETYLAEVIHVMPYRPHERYLELAPRYWTTTRVRLDPIELAREIGPITVPPPEEQPAPHASLSP